MLANLVERGPVCGRPVHRWADGTDEQPLCLMHSRDPAKAGGVLLNQFVEEISAELKRADSGKAHFESMVFPVAPGTPSQTFLSVCCFDHAEFWPDINLSLCTFAQDVRFCDVTFKGAVDFQNATFMSIANFTSARFEKDADFVRTKFLGDAYFARNEFKGPSSFTLARFQQRVFFRQSRFSERASFQSATIFGAADFMETTFKHVAVFFECRFHSDVSFRKTRFDHRSDNSPSATFPLARFYAPKQAIFDDVDLSRVLLHDCDVSQIWFTSKVRWAQRRSGALAIFEEVVPLDQNYAKSRLASSGHRNYHAVAQIYHQLKSNYDGRQDYWTADEFHYGEMEMQRLATRSGRRQAGLVHWLQTNLSLIALYRLGSDYGNSFTKPAAWLVFVLLAFAVLLPAIGLRPAPLLSTDNPNLETYASEWHPLSPLPARLKSELRLLDHSLLTSIDVATFQKPPDYVVRFPLGRWLAIVETLLSSTLVALFLLAVRRQFRR